MNYITNTTPRFALKDQHPGDGLPINLVTDIMAKDILNLTHAAALEDWSQVYIWLKSIEGNSKQLAKSLESHVRDEEYKYAKNLVPQ